MERSRARRRLRPAGDRRTVPLPDGTPLAVRPLRAWQRQALAAGFAALSAPSRRGRFLSAVTELSEPMLDRLVDEVDGVHHVAAVGYVNGRPVGVARIARLPSDPQTGDIAVTVLDEWQGRGVGSTLAAEVVRRTPGLRRLETVVACDNPASLRMLARLGRMTARVSSGYYDVAVDLAEAPGAAAGAYQERPRGTTANMTTVPPFDPPLEPPAPSPDPVLPPNPTDPGLPDPQPTQPPIPTPEI